MPLILLTNDDGIHAPGLRVLEQALAPLGEIWTIAPDVERSACGRAVTLKKPLRVRELGPRRLAVDGTPTDCVLLAFRTILQATPDFVFSGINAGYNIGEDIDYSGTVAAAAEGALQGARLGSVALSVEVGSAAAVFERAARFSIELAGALATRPLPDGTFLNVNFPPVATERVRWTRQGNRLPPGDVVIGEDPRGGRYYWIANRPEEDHPPPDTDRGAIRDGCISLCLLSLDRTYQVPWRAPILGGGLVVEEDVGLRN